MKILKDFYTKHRRGFTIIEVLVVVTILGVLAAITVPAYNKMVKKSRVADGLNVLELLSSAEGKYYMQNEGYTSKLAQLNVPIKGKWITETDEDKLETRNFLYTKTIDQTTNCISANSRDPNMSYTLVRNYKTNKVGCIGEACGRLKDYVDNVGDPSTMCPTGQQCEVQECGEGQHWEGLPVCACVKNDIPLGPACSSSQNTQWTDTGEKCEYTGPIPLFGNKASDPGPGNDQPDPGGLIPAPQPGVCGSIFERHVCNRQTGKLERQTECQFKKCPKNYKLDKDCNCVPYKECTGPMPLCAGGYSKCDPCPSAPDLPIALEEIYAQHNTEPAIRGIDPGNPPATTICYHCGFRKNNDTPICNHETGHWTCQGNDDEPCEEVSGGVMAVYGEACDGDGLAGTSCGRLKLTDVQCKQDCGTRGGNPNSCGKPYLNPVYGGCVLAPGNACFDGQTKPCTGTQSGNNSNNRGDNDGVYVCSGCHWGDNCVFCPTTYTPKYRKCTTPTNSSSSSVNVSYGNDKGNHYNEYCGNFISQKGQCNINVWEDDWSDTECHGSFYPSSPEACVTYTNDTQNDRGEGGKGTVVSQCKVKKYVCGQKTGTGGMFGWVASENQCEWIDPSYECETGNTTSQGCPSGQVKVCKDCKWSTQCVVQCGANPECDPTATPAQLAALGIASCDNSCKATCLGSGVFHNGKCYEAHYETNNIGTLVFGDKKGEKKNYRVYEPGTCNWGGAKAPPTGGEDCCDSICEEGCNQQCADWSPESAGWCRETCYDSFGGLCGGTGHSGGYGGGGNGGGGNGGGGNGGGGSSQCSQSNPACTFLSGTMTFQTNCTTFCKGQETGYCQTASNVNGAVQDPLCDQTNIVPSENTGVYVCRIAQ